MFESTTLDEILATWLVPILEKSIESLSYELNGDTLKIKLGFPIVGFETLFENSLQQHLKAHQFSKPVSIQFITKIASHQAASGLKGIPSIKNIVAIASGKGGVGKSSVSANLAISLHRLGARVGLLDGDIYGPSQVHMLGANSLPESVDGKFLKPVLAHGIETMSMAYLIEDDKTPMAWRGPMASKALMQLLFETQWGELDYLILDLPPGTGDIQLTLAQKIPLSASIVVTTPQDIALIDVKKAIRLFEKVRVPVLGVVENMNLHICTNCGHQEHIFSSGGVARLKSEFDVDCLASFPIDRRICEDLDAGQPSALRDDALAQTFHLFGINVAAKLSLHAKHYAVKFPNIVIEQG